MDPHTVTEHALADVLLDLTDTLGEEFDAGGLVHELATAATKVLDVDAVGVELFAEDGRLVLVAATDVRIEGLDQRQTGTGSGPSSDSGFRVVDAVPMGLRDDVVGNLVLFRHRPGPLGDADRRAARLLAAAAATGLLHRRAVHELETVNGQLRQALRSRVPIEQAKGFLVASLGVGPDAAFALLRAHARRRRQRLTVIAEAVVDRRLELDPPRATRRG